MTAGTQVRVRVLLFARLRELAGERERELELAAGATVEDAWSALGLGGREGIRGAVNQEFAGFDVVLADGDELAFIPPVSGGSGAGEDAGVLIELTADVLDARRLEAAVANPRAGAICTFTGVVRDNARGFDVTHLEYEAYPGMAESEMRAIAREIAQKWPGARVAMAHRTGRLEIGEASVVVSVSSAHRAEAIAACQWGIDRLKESVPVWKKEYAAGGATWVEGPSRPA